MPTRPDLTLFDLDHTLLDGDSNQLWLAWLVEQGAASPGRLAQQTDFYARYQAGTLDIDAYLAFHLSLLVERSVEAWLPLRDAFVAARIAPRITDAARKAVAAHRERGDTIAVVTATHDFLAAGIVALLGAPPLVATRCAASTDGLKSSSWRASFACQSRMPNTGSSSARGASVAGSSSVEGARGA